MPVTYAIDAARQVVWTVASGVVTYPEVVHHLVEEERDDALGLAEVIDARAATTKLTSDEVRSLVALTDTLLRKGRFGALALVTEIDMAFGMARMYQILVESLPVEIGVFRDLGDAVAWLDTVRSNVS